uniref:Uncharacterized protein n=1 Tax=Zea mays TaxID=4577 RepID=A0A804MR74_MAIZE
MFHSDYCTSGSWAVPQLELAPHKPLAKFLCIKGIVFFCFWQNTPTYCTALHIFVPGFRARYLSWSRRDQIPPFLAGRGAHPGGHPERAGDPRDGRVFRRPLYGLVRFYPNPYGLRGFQS